MKYEPDRAGGAFAEAESGPDDAGIRPSEKRENVPERCHSPVGEAGECA